MAHICPARLWCPMPTIRVVSLLAFMIETLTVVAIILMLSSASSLDMRLVFMMIVAGLSSCVLRRHYLKCTAGELVAFLILHIVEALVVLAFALLTESFGDPTGDEQPLHAVSFLAGALVLAGDALLLAASLGLVLLETEADKAKRPHTPPKLQCVSACEPGAFQEGACIICLEDLDVAGEEAVELQCGHRFHLSCLQSWIKARSRKPWCPLRCDCSDRGAAAPQQSSSSEAEAAAAAPGSEPDELQEQSGYYEV
mmetsp:Transcript_31424/g.73385  ORF Transcript_31424/g.73385 Transcript_31424/m.73385 type:complete len:255 (-) Transcript_31424:345-1109(-)